MREAIPRASASIQMVNKILDKPFVQSSDRCAFPTCPMNQVLGGSNMPASRYLRIAGLAQLLSKPFKQAAIRAVAEFLDA
jgi:hypothetical protein